MVVLLLSFEVETKGLQLAVVHFDMLEEGGR